MLGMKRRIWRWLRKIKYAIFYGIKPVVKTVTVEGVQFEIVLHPIKNGGVDIVIYNTGEWEPHVVKVFKKYLKPGAVFVDIGANIGYHSLFVSKFLNGQCKVHSFEPQPDLCKQLSKSLLLNSLTCVTVHNYGLANTSENHEIIIRDENIGSSSMIGAVKENPLVISGRQTVALKRMDDVFAVADSISFIKIDVEGFEYEVFLGGEQTLRKHKPIILFEYSPLLYRTIDEELPIKILNYLSELGYTFYDVGRGEDFSVESDLFAHPQRDLLCRVRA